MVYPWRIGLNLDAVKIGSFDCRQAFFSFCARADSPNIPYFRLFSVNKSNRIIFLGIFVHSDIFIHMKFSKSKERLVR